MACIIEEIQISDNPMPHDMVCKILSAKHTALVAAGSPACIRTLWFRAFRLGKIHRFYGTEISETEYALGKQIHKIKECICEALKDSNNRHIIVYASCMEVISMCDLEEELKDMELSPNASIHVFYRGPMVKRKSKPMAVLEEILRKTGETEEDISDDAFQNYEHISSVSNSKPPELPDFAKILISLQGYDCDILLLSPGGCKSCVEETCLMDEVVCSENTYGLKKGTAGCYATRIDDIALSVGCSELKDIILQTFTKERPLILLGSAVFHMIGFDGENLAKNLNESGKKAIWIESNGFCR